MRAEPSSHRWMRHFLREPINALTHALGVLGSVLGTVLLLARSDGDLWRMVSFALYGGSSIVLFLASTLLHGWRAKPRAEDWLRRADHAAIFLLIAGSYTPIALVSLRPLSPAWAWSLVGTVWGLALLGLAFKLTWFTAPRWFSTVLYLGLGWVAVAAAVPLSRAIDLGGLLWLAAAGLIYTGGAVIYALKRPSPLPNVFGYHEIWHLFVLAGGACVFIAMYVYVVPP